MAQDDLATDGPRSWVVAACCCFINLTFYGVSRLSGIMLVTATHTFQVSRASAAVPFSLCTAVRNLAGVFVGHLGHRFGVGAVVATGCFFASLGSGLCFFAQDIQWLTICWGAIFGFGFGLSTCLLPLAINKNFVKHNGTASGISYSGSYLGSFIFPPIIVWLIDSFGFQGTFLIISGAVLNGFVAAILLREPNSHKKRANISFPQNSFCSDEYSDHKSVSVICKNVKFGEMWKQNINRAFLDSQGNIRENFKSHSKYDNSTNNISLLHERVPESFHKLHKEEFSKCDINNSNLLYSSTNIHHLHKSFRNFKFESSFSRTKEFEKNPSSEITSSSSYLNSSPKDCDSFQTSQCSNVHFPESTHVTSSGGVTKETTTTSKVHFRKLFESRLFCKGKYKAKFRLKLQKLRRKILEAFILRNRTPTLKEFIQSGNVKLTSFKYLQSFLYPNLCGVCVTNHYFRLSTPSGISKRQDERNDQLICYDNQISTVQQNSIKKELNFSDLPALKITTDAESVLNDLLNRNTLFSVNNHRQNAIANNHNSMKGFICTHLPPLANTTCDDVSSNKCSISDDASSICKTEDSQSSFGEPSASSKLFLQNKSTSRTNSLNSSHSESSAARAASGCFSDWFHMLREPMFTVIGFTMSIQTFILVSVITTIEDFAKDVGISENRTHYALMTLSVSNLIGTLTLGSITDRGLISRHRFLSLCFFGMSLSLVALSLFAVSLSSLLSLVTVYGLLESGVIITFPILMKQFMKGERRQAIAIASSNVLSAPTVMLVPMLIGHFRDNIGSYSGLFHLLGGTSLFCSLLWLVAPSIRKNRSLKKKRVLIINNC